MLLREMLVINFTSGQQRILFIKIGGCTQKPSFLSSYFPVPFFDLALSHWRETQHCKILSDVLKVHLRK